MASFADIQYCIYSSLTPLVGGSEKVQNHADVIHGWSLKVRELDLILLRPMASFIWSI